ncbi:MAG: class I SAM-dependent methyltransferase [Lachnospiraceae bacterium]|nr:class I SAM-dependent methyltransferase [Lachnospiraceae bacterium]
MENQLDLIAESYDRGIDLGRQGISSYENFPSYITNHPNYPLFQQMEMNETLSDSGRKEIVGYLMPKVGMKFIDLGCCLNLMFRGYKGWPSTYYGVDISRKTIELLHEFTEKNDLTVGDLYCGSMHATPYDTNFFDIGACIGSLEYFEKDFVQQAVVEFHRIMKPNGKCVLDIPNVGSPEFEIAKLIEEYLGRPDKFNLSVKEFETLLDAYFVIDKKEIVGPMIQFFLICKK